MESAEPPPKSRSIAWLLVILVIGVLGFVLSLGPTGGGPRYHVIRGRIEVPDGAVLPPKLVIERSRQGQPILAPPQPPNSSTWKVVVAPDGWSATFSVYVTEGEPVDLQLAIDDAEVLQGTGPDGNLTMEDWARWQALAASRPAATRDERRIGAWVGILRNVDPDDQDVVIRLVPRVAGRMRLRVIDPEGWAVSGVKVELRSMLDSCAGRSDADGRVVFEDVALREWEATAEVPKQRTASLVRGKVRAAPNDVEVTLPLRKGVRMRVRLPKGSGLPTHLSFGRPGSDLATPLAWTPDPEGTVGVLLEPDWPHVTLTATARAPPPLPSFLRIDVAKATVPVEDGAEVTLALVR